MRRVKTQDYSSLFASLDSAIEIVERNRTPAPGFVAAFDTLKQARAMLAAVLSNQRVTQLVPEDERAAA